MVLVEVITSLDFTSVGQGCLMGLNHYVVSTAAIIHSSTYPHSKRWVSYQMYGVVSTRRECTVNMRGDVAHIQLSVVVCLLPATSWEQHVAARLQCCQLHQVATSYVHCYAFPSS